MTTVECLKNICKTRRIPISRLEKDCGFSNGYIGQLKKGTMPDDRLRIVAEYLNVDPIELSKGTIIEKMVPSNHIINVQYKYPRYEYYTEKETAAEMQKLLEDKDIRILLDAYSKMSASQAKAFVEFAKETVKEHKE